MPNLAPFLSGIVEAPNYQPDGAESQLPTDSTRSRPGIYSHVYPLDLGGIGYELGFGPHATKEGTLYFDQPQRRHRFSLDYMWTGR